MKVDAVVETPEMEAKTVLQFPRRTFVGMAALVLSVVAIVAGVSAAVLAGDFGGETTNINGGGGGKENTKPPIFPATNTTMAFDKLVELIGPEILSDPSVFKDPSTPQYNALTWIVDDNKWYEEVTPKFLDQILVERYAVMVLYFLTENPSALSGATDLDNGCFFPLNSQISVCEWQSIRCDYGDNLVTGIFLYQFDICLIPSELGLFMSMPNLNLARSNTIRGSIATELGCMTNLEVEGQAGYNSITVSKHSRQFFFVA